MSCEMSIRDQSISLNRLSEELKRSKTGQVGQEQPPIAVKKLVDVLEKS